MSHMNPIFTVGNTIYEKILAGLDIGKWANLNQLEGKIVASELHVWLKLILKEWVKIGEWLNFPCMVFEPKFTFTSQLLLSQTKPLNKLKWTISINITMGNFCKVISGLCFWHLKGFMLVYSYDRACKNQLCAHRQSPFFHLCCIITLTIYTNTIKSLPLQN